MVSYGNKLYTYKFKSLFLNRFKFPTEERVANINCFVKSTHLRHVAIFCSLLSSKDGRKEMCNTRNVEFLLIVIKNVKDAFLMCAVSLQWVFHQY